MARGALISMVTVITVLPAVLLLFDPLIVRTSAGFLPGRDKIRDIRKTRKFRERSINGLTKARQKARRYNYYENDIQEKF